VKDLTNERVRTISLVIIAVILGAAALYWLKPVMIPFILAFLLTYLLKPVIQVLQDRLKIPSGGAVLVSILLCCLLFYCIGLLVASSVSDLSKNSNTYQTKLGHLVDDGVAWLEKRGFDVDETSIKTKIASFNWGEKAGQLANGVITMLSNGFLILIFAIYLLQGSLRPAIRAGPVREKIEGRIKRYISIKIGLSAITGILTATILTTLGVDAALLFGTLAFLLNFIPSVGSIIATLLPLPLVLFEPTVSTTTLVLTLVLPATVHVIIGNVIEPKVMGDSLQLHPITILLSLVFWGMLWGVPGMLLAVPISATICVLLDSQSGTRPIARLMSGEGDTSPSELTP
jgi:AI-2 transport protein TqsA